MKEINRDKYLNALINKIDNGSIKIITGLRRSGKSYLLNVIFFNYLCNNYNKNKIIKFAFDSPEDLALIGEDYIEIHKEKRKVSSKKFLDFINSKIDKKGKYFLLLDEIQELEVFESVLNGLLNKRNIDIFVTGSNSKLLVSDVRTEFRGRGDEIRIYPLSFREFFSSSKKDKNEAFNEYMIYGGMPLVLNYKTDEEKAKYLNDLFESTYYKDIEDRYGIKNEEVLSKLINILASSIGSLTNPTKLANTFKSNGINTNDKTINAYTNYLLDAFLINKAEKYDVKGKKYISSPCKYYFTDIGLRNARLNFRQIEQTHLMENIIYNELKIRGYSVDVGVVHKYSRDGNGKQIVSDLEIDFVCNQGNKRYYIQSAFSIPDEEKMNQEQASLLRTSDEFKKIIIVKDNTKLWRNEQGITIMNIIDFLLDENSLDL